MRAQRAEELRTKCAGCADARSVRTREECTQTHARVRYATRSGPRPAGLDLSLSRSMAHGANFPAAKSRRLSQTNSLESVHPDLLSHGASAASRILPSR